MAQVCRKIGWRCFLSLRRYPERAKSTSRRHYHVCTISSTSQQRILKLRPIQQIQNRDFFQLPKLPNPKQLLTKKKRFNERKIIGYSAEEMYSIVADVNQYQDFLPWCKKSIVTMSTPTNLEADLLIGFPPITESYTSRVTMKKPYLIKVESLNNNLSLNTLWKFGPGLPGNSKTCTLEIDITFEFQSAIHSNLASLFLDEVVRKMTNAFLDRAQILFGKESVKAKIVFQNTYS